MSNTISQAAAHEESLTCELNFSKVYLLLVANIGSLITPKITKSVLQATVMATGS